MNYFRSILSALFLFSSSLAWAMGNAPSARTQSHLIGKAAPDVVLTRSDGISSGVIGSRQGKKAILIFWATWCSPCYQELGLIYAQWASIEHKGIKIILVDAGETKEVVKDYFDRRQMKLVSFVDEDSFLQGAYHLTGVPTLIFIDEKGIIRSVTHQFPSDYENYFNVE